ncbi:MAG: hypothetical protein LBC20_01650 [Planctomycetaceae bacterium]|jgi:hypothetical protein|nr:hypothetical protein [Planctomycetaceae bacterium]
MVNESRLFQETLQNKEFYRSGITPFTNKKAGDLWEITGVILQEIM